MTVITGHFVSQAFKLLANFLINQCSKIRSIPICNNELSEKEMKKQTTFAIATKKKK